ncbi:hypothetical protein HNY73_006995 [Argiope bruennichi]|uniref:Spidroin C-terminal domain-containing protein n=1 Tax=Argiope bruennichi TaxID=94029 RepID=A0A8T0FJM7_ARGBR|nr:hypothetical protein HNY73_006995 [Argiope bruennichi]
MTLVPALASSLPALRPTVTLREQLLLPAVLTPATQDTVRNPFKAILFSVKRNLQAFPSGSTGYNRNAHSGSVFKAILFRSIVRLYRISFKTDGFSRTTAASSGSVSGQRSVGQTSAFSASTESQGVFGQSSGSASRLAFGAGQSAGAALTGALNSPIGLRSGSAASRINQLTSSLTNSIGPNGVDANALARSLQSSFSNLRSSGMSSSDAKIEVFKLESHVGCFTTFESTRISRNESCNGVFCSQFCCQVV